MRLKVVMVLALVCALAASSSVAGAAAPAGGPDGQAAKKKKCGKGKTRVKRKGRSSVCAKKCKARYKHKVGRRGKVSCVRRRSGAKKPAPQGKSGPKAGNYSGTTAQNRPITFTVAGGQVTNFQAGVNTFCSTPGNSRIVIDAIANIPPMAIGPDGSFSYKGNSGQGNPEITGKITGGSATGTVGMNRGDTNFSGGQMTFGACTASGVTWSAAG